LYGISFHKKSRRKIQSSEEMTSAGVEAERNINDATLSRMHGKDPVNWPMRLHMADGDLDSWAFRTSSVV